MGKVYVLGAGVSKTVGYPLGTELFDELDKFIRSCGPCFDRFDYREWPKICGRLSRTANTLIRSAYEKRQIEHLLTILDLSSLIRSEFLDDVLFASKLGIAKVKEAEESYKRLEGLTRRYQGWRQILLWALEAFFLHRHEADLASTKGGEWDLLRRLCQRLNDGDVIITFNYDSTVERVLLEQGKWSPCSGYGFEIPLQESRTDPRLIAREESAVTVLHLHGAIGWFQRPALAPGVKASGSGAMPTQAVAAGALTSEVALDPLFLRGLGMSAVDAALPMRPPDEAQILLHPSFFKDYELEDSANTVFIRMWKRAAADLRAADAVTIIGYSLPKADSASMTLLLTNCDPEKVSIVNSSKMANRRLRQLLSKDRFGKPCSFEEWLG